MLLLESFFSAVLTPMVPAFRQELDCLRGHRNPRGRLCRRVADLLDARGVVRVALQPADGGRRGCFGVGLSSVAFGWAGHATMLEASRFLLGAFGALMWAGGMSWTISAAGVDGRGQVMGTLLAAAVAAN